MHTVYGVAANKLIGNVQFVIKKELSKKYASMVESEHE